MDTNLSYKDEKKHENINSAWSIRRISKRAPIWDELSLPFLLLKGAGIIIPNSLSGRLKLSAHVYRVIGTLLFSSAFAFIASEVAFCGFTKFVSSAAVICMSLTLSMSLLLWITMLKRSKMFSKLVHKIDNILICCNPTTSGCNSQRHTRMLSLYVLAVPVVTSTLCMLSVQVDDIYFYLNCYLFGNDFLKSNHFYKDYRGTLMFLFLTIENYVQFFLPNLVTLLVFLLCEYINKSLRTFVEYCKYGNWPTHYAVHRRSKELKIFKFYRNIKDTFNSLDDLISFPIFLIISQKFVTLFFTLTVILSKTKVSMQLIESFFFAVNGVLSISLLIVAGSRMKESHKRVRELFLELPSLPNDQNAFEVQGCEVLSVLKAFVEREDLVLTAAGMIPLTRSLFLKIGAALVTYGVLIVQFDSRT